MNNQKQVAQIWNRGVGDISQTNTSDVHACTNPNTRHRGEICHCRHCRRQCKIFCQWCKFLQKRSCFVFLSLKLLKFSEIKGVKSLAWKSGCVQISCLPQHHCHHKSRCQYHSEKRISSPNLTGTHYQGVPPSIAFEMIIINLALVIGCQRCFENFGFLRHRWLFACVQT